MCKQQNGSGIVDAKKKHLRSISHEHFSLPVNVSHRCDQAEEYHKITQREIKEAF